jgi:hypothetical protein
MTPIIHNYSSVSSKTLYWDTSDNEQTYLKNLQNPEKKQLLLDAGYVDNSITYQFNSHGFRNKEFDQKFDIACFGCSFTMGTGVHNLHTWPQQLADLTNLNVANLGLSGSSNDCSYRMAEHYLKWLQPKYAVWVQTDQHRLEIVNNNDKIAVNILASDSDNFYSNNFFIKTWMTSETNQILNLNKNTRAFANLCQEIGIIPLIILRQEIINIDFARDLRHPGQKSYAQLAMRIKNLIAI